MKAVAYIQAYAIQPRCLPDHSIHLRGLRILLLPVGLLVAGIMAGSPVLAADYVENTFGMRFIHIPAGSFTMGTVEVEAARTMHITSSIYLSETELIQGVWYRSWWPQQY